ncbi:hypothetical protein ELI02_32350 [Rhizobium leguminosarum]|nr:hypothetical protein ELI02_32350 [Rhizobium leguminosarum]TAX47290.1 hypothetical protein ELI01_29635 [Rhizobium leguminosarum]TAX85779.1 hypothetical protein ELH95_34190 [Rhizobium leguminosarum]
MHSGTFAKGTYDSNLGYEGGIPYADMMTLPAYPTDKAPNLHAPIQNVGASLARLKGRAAL